MPYARSILRFLTACGLAAAALLACGVTVHAQGARGSSGMGSSSLGSGSSLGSSSGFGGSGGFGGGSSLGSSSGFGNGSSGQFSFAGGSSFVGSSGGSSFAGSSSGFTGSSSGFTGSSSGFTGSSYGGGGGFRGGSSYSGVSNTNFLASSFANPLAAGISSGSNVSFGQPLYSNLMSNSTNLLGGSSGMGSSRMGGGLGSSGLGSTGTQASGGSYGALGVVAGRNSVVMSVPGGAVPVAPGGGSPAVAAIGPAIPVPVQLAALPARLQTDLQNLVSRADLSPATRSAVTFGLDGTGTVVLRGAAANAADARAIESLIRFAPGVRAVRNEMTVP